METTRQIIETFAGKAGLPQPSFIGWDFRSLSDAEACSSVIEYFSDSVPALTLDFGHLRLLSPTQLFQENTELIPGCEISPHGIVTIAATDTGDSVAVDLLSGIVFLVSHDKFEGGMISPGWKPDYSGFFDSIPITRANIITACEVEWPDIQSALISLLNPEER